MRKILLSSAMTMVLMVPALAAGGSAQTNQPAITPSQAASSADKAPTQTEWIAVTSAEHLVDRNVQSKDGKEAGEIDGLVLDLPRAHVVYALIRSGGDLDIGSERIAVPFRTLQAPLPSDDDVVVINQDLSKLQNGKRIAQDRFSDLGNPNQIRDIYGAYGVQTPSGYLVPPSSERDVRPNTYMLVRPDQLAMLDHANMTSSDNNVSAEAVRGNDVQRSNGEELGEIDQIMIDPSVGRVSYLLLSSGGFLGMGTEWLPVPAQALTWASDKQAFVLKDEKVQPTAMQPLHKTELPGQVRRSDVKALYERFDATPYWDDQSQKDQG